MTTPNQTSSGMGLIVLVSVGLSAAVAVAIALTLGPPAGDPPALVEQERLASLEQENAKLRTALERLGKRLEDAESRAVDVRSTVNPEALTKAVDAWLAKHGNTMVAAMVSKAIPEHLPAAGLPSEADAAPTAAADGSVDLQQVFLDLQGKNLWTPESQKLLAEIAKAGKMEELLDVFRKHAKANPQDAVAQTALGSMLLQACDHCSSDSQKGKYAAKADQAFDQALKVDPEHWDARFTKALAYTFWPAFTGKPAEAVKHFEQLIQQQERRRPEEHYAQTYLYLGNLHAQSGNRTKAQQIWRQGLRLYPNNAELQQKLP